MKTSKKIFPVGALIVAAWFLFNPNISILDLLPDCIAYLCILFALRHLTPFVPYMREAADGFRKLFYVSLIKLPALVVMLTMASERVTITLFSLSFAIVELIFLFPAVHNLFEGLFYLGERFGCESAIKADRLKNGPEAIRTVTYLFVSVKMALSTLPDFAFLFNFDRLSGDGFTISNTQYAILLFLAFLLSLIMGVIWLGYILPYFKAIRRDPGVDALTPPDCENVHVRENRRLRLSLPYFLFAAGICLSVDLVFDNVAVPPDYLSAIFFTALALILFFTVKQYRILTLVLSGGYVVSSILYTVFRNSFFREFILSDLTRIPEADTAYLPVILLSVVNELLFLSNVIMLGRTLIEFRKKNSPTPPPAESYEGRVYLSEEHDAKKQNLLCLILAALTAVASALDTFLARYTVDVSAHPGYSGSMLYVPVFSGFWLLPLLFSVALAIDTVWICSTRVRSLWEYNDLEITNERLDY